MKILHYVDENNLTWARSWIELLKCLEKEGISNSALCRSGGTLGTLLASAGIQHYEYTPCVAAMPHFALSLASRLNRLQPDIIHTRLSSAAYIGGLWGEMLRIPVVSSVDKFTKIKYYRRANLLLPCSAAVQDDIVSKGFPEKDTLVIHNALDYNKYVRNESIRCEYRAKLGIAPNEPIVAAAGRFDDGKGFPLLLEAFSELDTGCKARLILLGDGPQRESLRLSAESFDLNERVIMPGFVKDVRPWLWASDIFVFPSDGPDAFGMSLLEAMAAGNAPIAADCGGPREIITSEAEGCIVPRGSAEAITKALRRYIEFQGERESAAASAVKRAACFDVSKTAASLSEVYKKLCPKGA